MTDPKTLITQLRGEFEKNPLVKAFVLVGSQARDEVYTASKYSDMEAYVITRDEDAEKLEGMLPEVLSKTGTILFSFKHAIGFVAVYKDLFILELPVIKLSGMNGLFIRPKAQVVKVLIDRTNGKLEEILDSRPEEIDYAVEFKEKVVNFWFWQILAAQYYRVGEIYNTRGVLGVHVSALIWMFELLNDPKILLLEVNKRIEQFLPEEQLSLIKKVSPAYDGKSIHTALIDIMDIFSKVVADVKKKYGYDFDETLEQRVKPQVLDLLRQ